MKILDKILAIVGCIKQQFVSINLKDYENKLGENIVLVGKKADEDSVLVLTNIERKNEEHPLEYVGYVVYKNKGYRKEGLVENLLNYRFTEAKIPEFDAWYKSTMSKFDNSNVDTHRYKIDLGQASIKRPALVRMLYETTSYSTEAEFQGKVITRISSNPTKLLEVEKEIVKDYIEKQVKEFAKVDEVKIVGKFLEIKFSNITDTRRLKLVIAHLKSLNSLRY